MDSEALAIAGLMVVTPTQHGDDRGFFMERFNRAGFARAVGRDVDFVQDNHSRSVRGVLRGLHFQLPPHPQAKLVSVLAGEIFDVAVDIRRSSPTFGRWQAVVLSAENRRQLWVPEGFAHGFLVLSESADVLYKTSGYYAPASDRAIAWNDPALAIEWPLDGAPTLSPRDASAPTLAHAEVFA
jgi:dTDP-4-dehydrorhamnose 3,5-epimerase